MKKNSYYLKDEEEVWVICDLMEATHRIEETEWETPQGPMFRLYDLDGNALRLINIPKEALVFEDEE